MLAQLARTAAALAALAAPLPCGAGQEPAPDPSCRIVGRVVDAAGAPIAGARLALNAGPASAQRVALHGAPKDWRAPAPAESDAAGRFALELVPPRAFAFALSANAEGYCEVAWTWGALAPGAELDLGDVLLEPPAVIVGHVADARGELLVEGWRAMATPIGDAGPHGRLLLGRGAWVDPASGTFRIEGLPPGRVRVAAESAAGAHTGERIIETVAGRVNEVALLFDGTAEDLRGLLVVGIDTAPYRWLVPARGAVRATAADGSAWTLERVPGRPRFWQASGLPPGTCTVEIEDPNFERWRTKTQLPGPALNVQLDGSAALELTVRSARGAPPLVRYGLQVRYDDPRSRGGVWVLAPDGALAPPDGLFRGLVPGDLELELRAPDRPPRRVRVAALAPGETRAVEVTLPPAAALRGRVVHADGSPAAGARVELLRAGATADSPLETRADGAGCFALEALPPGPSTLRAHGGPFAWVERTVDPAADPREPTLELPPLGTLELALALPAGADATRMQVVARPLAAGPEAPWCDDAPLALSPEGACRIEGLPAGQVELRLRAQLAPPGARSVQAGALELGVAQVVAGGVAGHRVDLRERLDGLIELHATVAGAPARGLVAVLLAADGSRHPATPAAFRGAEPLSVQAPPGTWTVRVVDLLAGWTFEVGAPCALGAAQRVELRVDVPLVARALRVVDADGRPRAGLELCWWGAMNAPGRVVGRTDARGLLPLELPPGSYRLAPAAADPRARAVEFQFELAAGDEALEVVLPAGG